MWRVFFTSAVVAVVVRSAMGWCKNGNCGHFGSGGFIIWDISGSVVIPFLESLCHILISMFHAVVKKIIHFRNCSLWQLLALLVGF